MNRKKISSHALAEQIAEECIAVRLRLLTRAVTRLYNTALRPYGLTVSQMNILVAVSQIGQVRPHILGRALHLEKSTLSRDLARMRAQSWIEATAGEDSRTTLLSVTQEGKKLLTKVFPAWQEAQAQARELLGEQAVAAFSHAAKSVQARHGVKSE